MPKIFKKAITTIKKKVNATKAKMADAKEIRVDKKLTKTEFLKLSRYSRFKETEQTKQKIKIRENLISSYGNFSISKLESAIKYFEKYKEKFIEHNRKIGTIEEFAFDLELDCDRMIKTLNRGIRRMENTGKIEEILKNEIINNHVDFNIWLQKYKKVIKKL